MTERIDPIRRPEKPKWGDRRQFDRRQEDRTPDRPEPQAAAAPSNLPAPSAPQSHDHTSPPPLEGPAAFAAQLLGQPGQRRGLRAPGTVEAARSAYLETEYSGPADRRPPKGLIKKTEI